MQSQLPGSAEKKAEFRKPSNDAASRNYRRHSSDESPKREHGTASVLSKGDSAKTSENRRSKHEKELDRDSDRNYYGKDRGSYRISDRHSFKDSHGYSRHECYGEREKYEDRQERRYLGSSHSDRNIHSERAREETDHGRTRDFTRDRHRQDNSGRDDGDYYRSSKYQKSDPTLDHEDSRGYRNEFRGNDGDCSRKRETFGDDAKEVNTRQERKKPTGWDTNTEKYWDGRASMEQDEDKSVLGDGKQSSGLKQTEDADGKITVGQTHVESDSVAASDLNAAKVAAMKAAELVNKNLVGVGIMSTEQKKKLLWGNKKSTTSEQSSTQWNTALFDDRDRQEKFNKLMGVKGDLKEGNIPEKPDGGHLQAEKQKELQMDLEKQYTAGLRRRDGRTVGLGL